MKKNYRIFITFDRSTGRDPWDIQSWYIYEAPSEGLRSEGVNAKRETDRQSCDLHTHLWTDYQDKMLRRYRGKP